MRRFMLLLSSLLLLTISCELYYEQPIQKGKVRIVSIGITYENEIDGYDDLHDLPGTINDAKELASAFSQQAVNAGWDSSNVEKHLLLQEGEAHTEATFSDPSYPSKEKLEKKLKDIELVASEDDLTIITYSGHGIEPTGELLMAHTQTSGPLDISETSPIVVTPSWLHEHIVPIKGRKLLILDSCFGGSFIPSSSTSDSWIYEKNPYTYYETLFSGGSWEVPTFYVLTASANTESYEQTFDDHSHGVFSSALLEALGWNHDTETISGGTPPAAKEEALSIDSLYTYIKKHQVLPVRWSLFSIGTSVQHPMTLGGSLDMTLFRY